MEISTLVLILLCKSVMTLPVENQCERDSDCGVGFYCNDGICESCVPCNLFNRHPSSQFRNCARTEQDCGLCLPGFYAEELTNQRYSTRCSESQVSDPDHSSGSSAVLPWIQTVILPLSLVILAATGIFGVVYWRKRRPLIPATRQGNPTEGDHLMPPPPPYTESDLVHVPTTSKMNEINFVHVEDERMNETAPIGPRHLGPFENPDIEDFQLEAVEVNPPPLDSDRDSITSVETTPSHWEPGSTAEMDSSSQDRGMDLDLPRFARSQSLDLRRTSDSDMQPIDLGSAQSLVEQSKLGIYDGIHISLSSQRMTHHHEEGSSVGTDPSSSETSRVSSIQNVDDSEPDPPQSFQYLDVQSYSDHIHSDGHNNLTSYQTRFLHRSLSASGNTRSDDSGFVDYANSRRRRAVDQLEIGFTLHIKQPRK